ncbi:hypothetical protein DFJ73DRAFT_867053 [Zopfochytrium polystomum]|nr:hypothetical protein DFJ73DRAFT_867053 [Zopfochytrium polystomum]
MGVGDLPSVRTLCFDWPPFFRLERGLPLWPQSRFVMISRTQSLSPKHTARGTPPPKRIPIPFFPLLLSLHLRKCVRLVFLPSSSPFLLILLLLLLLLLLECNDHEWDRMTLFFSFLILISLAAKQKKNKEKRKKKKNLRATITR